MKWLDAVPKADYETEKSKTLSLKAELIAIRDQKRREHPIVSVDEGDPSPFDTAKRKMYVAQVAGFHKDILSPKIKHLIRLMREEFEKVNRDTFGHTQQEYDLYLKGAINFGWLINDWGESAINEVISYQQEEPSEEELTALKKTIN